MLSRKWWSWNHHQIHLKNPWEGFSIFLKTCNWTVGTFIIVCSGKQMCFYSYQNIFERNKWISKSLYIFKFIAWSFVPNLGGLANCSSNAGYVKRIFYIFCKSYFPLWSLQMCLFKYCDWENDFLQVSHL